MVRYHLGCNIQEDNDDDDKRVFRIHESSVRVCCEH